MNSYDVLAARVTELIQFSRKRARIYGFVYRALRVLIIVLSAITAGTAKYGDKTTGLSHTLTPYLAVSIAILASLEAWLKPGKIYWEHYRFNDFYISAETRLSLIPATDTKELAKFAKSLDDIDRQYHTAVHD